MRLQKRMLSIYSSAANLQRVSSQLWNLHFNLRLPTTCSYEYTHTDGTQPTSMNWVYKHISVFVLTQSSKWLRFNLHHLAELLNWSVWLIYCVQWDGLLTLYRALNETLKMLKNLKELKNFTKPFYLPLKS